MFGEFGIVSGLAASRAGAIPDRFSNRLHRDIAAVPAVLQRTDLGLRGLDVPAGVAGARRLLLVGDEVGLQAIDITKDWVERLTGLPCDARAMRSCSELAALPRHTAAVVVARSGADADTLAMLRRRAATVVVIADDAGSVRAPGAGLVWPTAAGAECGTAALVAAQSFALIRLGLAVGVTRGAADAPTAACVDRALAEAPVTCALAAAAEARFAVIGRRIGAAKAVAFMGRGASAGLAALGARIVAALTGIADAASGPAIVLAGHEPGQTEIATDAVALRVRGRHVVGLVEARACDDLAYAVDEMVGLPGRGLAVLFAQIVALHLVACHAALALGLDVDPPRHRAMAAA